jgi:hypothetical protein
MVRRGASRLLLLDLFNTAVLGLAIFNVVILGLRSVGRQCECS